MIVLRLWCYILTVVVLRRTRRRSKRIYQFHARGVEFLEDYYKSANRIEANRIEPNQTEETPQNSTIQSLTENSPYNVLEHMKKPRQAWVQSFALRQQGKPLND